MSKAAEREHLIGVDLGGTKVLSAVFDGSLKKIAQKKAKTRALDGEQSIFENICGSIEGAATKAEIETSDIGAIGIAIPGVFDRDVGIVTHTPNLPFVDFPLRERLEDRFEVRVSLENDVNAGTYGEFCAGAATGYRHVLGVFPGTGIGGGLILNGELFIGATGNAGEIGHMIIHPDGPLCGCGQYGCLEAYASRSAMAKDAVFLATYGSAPEALEMAGTDYSAYTSKVFSKAPKAGDTAIQRVVERAAWYLGIGLANCVNLLSPEAIVIGGGLIERLGKSYLSAIEASLRKHVMRGLGEHVELLEASLGDDAAIIGAAALAQERGVTA